MIEQVFATTDLASLAALAFLELALSADNAIVIGLLSHHLPAEKRSKALYIGMGSAIVLRLAALLGLSVILAHSWIEFIGAAYLIYLSANHFLSKKQSTPPTYAPFWKTILLIEMYDLIFSIDSIIAGLAFIDGESTKLWIVYAGGILGLLTIRFAANRFHQLIDRFPRLEPIAYLMVGWIGIKFLSYLLGYPLPPLLFWTVLVLLFLLSFFPSKR